MVDAAAKKRVDATTAAKAYKSYEPPVASGEWTVTTIRTAIMQHEQGQFQRSALLIDSMDRDDRVIGALETLILGILRLPFKLKPANDSEEAVQCRTSLWLVWRRVIRGQLYDAVRWMVMAGFALVELDWDTSDPDQWKLVRFYVWHLQFVWWDQMRKVFIVQTTEGPIEVDPENLGGKWMLLTNGGDRPWMRGAVRSLGDDFLSHDETWRDWRRDAEVHGSGIIKAKTPTSFSDEPAKKKWVDDISSMGREPVIECPQDEQGRGFDFEHMDTGKDHAAGFEKLIDKLVANINIRLLGQNASQENTGPYVSKGGLFGKVTLDRIDGVVGPLEDALHDHVGRPFADFNHGDPELAPSFDYDSEPPQDKQAQAQTMATVMTAAAAAVAAGYDLDEEEIRERYGFTLRAKPAPAPAPGNEGAAA